MRATWLLPAADTPCPTGRKSKSRSPRRRKRKRPPKTIKTRKMTRQTRKRVAQRQNQTTRIRSSRDGSTEIFTARRPRGSTGGCTLVPAVFSADSFLNRQSGAGRRLFRVHHSRLRVSQHRFSQD